MPSHFPTAEDREQQFWTVDVPEYRFILVTDHRRDGYYVKETGRHILPVKANYVDVRSTIITYGEELFVENLGTFRVTARMSFTKDEPKHYSSIFSFCIQDDSTQDTLIKDHLQRCAQQVLLFIDSEELPLAERRIRVAFARPWEAIGMKVEEFSLNLMEED